MGNAGSAIGQFFSDMFWQTPVTEENKDRVSRHQWIGWTIFIGGLIFLAAAVFAGYRLRKKYENQENSIDTSQIQAEIKACILAPATCNEEKLNKQKILLETMKQQSSTHKNPADIKKDFELLDKELEEATKAVTDYAKNVARKSGPPSVESSEQSSV